MSFGALVPVVVGTLLVVWSRRSSSRGSPVRAGGGNDTTELYFTGLIERATPYAWWS